MKKQRQRKRELLLAHTLINHPLEVFIYDLILCPRSGYELQTIFCHLLDQMAGFT